MRVGRSAASHAFFCSIHLSNEMTLSIFSSKRSVFDCPSVFSMLRDSRNRGALPNASQPVTNQSQSEIGRFGHFDSFGRDTVISNVSNSSPIDAFGTLGFLKVIFGCGISSCRFRYQGCAESSVIGGLLRACNARRY